MEDAHTCMPQLSGELTDWGYFAVFDGHAGSTVAQYCSRNLLDRILATGGVKASEDPEQVKEGIHEGFLDIDRHMHKLARQDNWDRSGSTAAAVMISPRYIYFINCGDSRTLLCRNGRVVFYTEDHKPFNPREKERIQNAGGSVTLQRVNGSLAVSRALGDFDFKEVDWRPQTEQLVSPEPEVYELERTPEDEFLILACDGVWDAIGNEELCAFVCSRLQVCDDLREICTQVIDLCLYKGSLDNISIIIICFPGAPQVSKEALQQEAELEKHIDMKVGEIIQMIRSRDEDPDLLYVIKFLAAEEMSGLPPGGGITSKRDCIISAYQKHVMTLRTQEPMSTQDGTAQPRTLVNKEEAVVKKTSGKGNKPQRENPGPMPLNARDTGYDSMPAPGLSGSVGGSESAPLLIPEPEPVQQWRPMSRQELEAAAGGPGWRKVRCYLVLLFWLAWVAMLATSIAIIVKSPKPEAKPLKWWQKSLFYQLQPDMFMEAQTEGSRGINALCEQLPYLRSLGIGALILEGLFDKKASPLNLTVTGENLGTLPQIEHLLRESSKAGLKVVLDFCELDLLGPQDVADEPSNPSETPALRFWLEQGVAGFLICDTDAAYSEKTLLVWRGVFKEFSSEEEERIVVVKQTRDVLPPLSNSSQINVTLVDLVMRSILPTSPLLLSTEEVADAIETRLQTAGDIWPSWTIGGKASHDMNNLLLVLMMTLPGSPVVQYDEEMDQTQNVSLHLASSNGEQNNKQSDSDADKEKMKRSAVALFTSLSHSRAREEALLYGNFTFLPFNASSNSTPSSPPILAFLRSWGCVHFLILLNVGPELHALDPAWAPSLPEAGVFVTSTGMDRLGSTSLYTLELRPHEAIVIKLFEAGSYS
ncbi:hypothetical protein PAMP_018585 [Pampus punctatissimus]